METLQLGPHPMGTFHLCPQLACVHATMTIFCPVMVLAHQQQRTQLTRFQSTTITRKLQRISHHCPSSDRDQQAWKLNTMLPQALLWSKTVLYSRANADERSKRLVKANLKAVVSSRLVSGIFLQTLLQVPLAIRLGSRDQRLKPQCCMPPLSCLVVRAGHRAIVMQQIREKLMTMLK